MLVPSHASVSKYYADKTYANLWFILLQVTKGFRFQKNQNVRFISGNFLSQSFVKTIRCGLHILINQQAPAVSVFRIYHIETHVTNICQKNNKLLT